MGTVLTEGRVLGSGTKSRMQRGFQPLRRRMKFRGPHGWEWEKVRTFQEWGRLLDSAWMGQYPPQLTSGHLGKTRGTCSGGQQQSRERPDRRQGQESR